MIISHHLLTYSCSLFTPVRRMFFHFPAWKLQLLFVAFLWTSSLLDRCSATGDYCSAFVHDTPVLCSERLKTPRFTSRIGKGSRFAFTFDAFTFDKFQRPSTSSAGTGCFTKRVAISHHPSEGSSRAIGTWSVHAAESVARQTPALWRGNQFSIWFT